MYGVTGYLLRKYSQSYFPLLIANASYSISGLVFIYMDLRYEQIAIAAAYPLAFLMCVLIHQKRNAENTK